MAQDTIWLPQINPRICMGCGACIASCPSGSLSWEAGKAALGYPDRCGYCATCEEICPVSAIELPLLIMNHHHQERGNHE